MVAVLQRRLSPDEASFEVAASTTSTLLIVCGDRNIALTLLPWPTFFPLFDFPDSSTVDRFFHKFVSVFS